MYIIDGYAGEPHITAPQVGDYNAGITGENSCVLKVGEKLRAEIIDTNTVRIYDGSFIFQGYRRGGINAGAYEDVSIENGTQSQKRNDIIAIKYERDSGQKTESFHLAVIKGTAGDTAVDPAIEEGNIRDGDSVCYMPLYRVTLNGINVTGIASLFIISKSIMEINNELVGKAPVYHSSSDMSYGAASVTQFGHVKLNNSVDSESTSEAATPNAVKTVYDLAALGFRYRGGVSDALTEPSELGYYTYSFNTKNAPAGGELPGIIFVLPFPGFYLMRFALTFDNRFFTNVVQNGASWGEWKEK